MLCREDPQKKAQDTAINKSNNDLDGSSEYVQDEITCRQKFTPHSLIHSWGVQLVEVYTPLIHSLPGSSLSTWGMQLVEVYTPLIHSLPGSSLSTWGVQLAIVEVTSHAHNMKLVQTEVTSLIRELFTTQWIVGGNALTIPLGVVVTI